MNRRRAHASATLLPNGEVLVVGGFDGSIPLASAELDDPATGDWTLTAPLVWCDNEGGGCEVGPTHPAEIYTP